MFLHLSAGWISFFEKALPLAGWLLAGLLLIGAFFSLLAKNWCWVQDRIRASKDEWMNSDVVPNPLKSRWEWLNDHQGTPLMEGDVGAFILRKQEVSHEYTAGFLANVMISLALFFTIIGLILTMTELSTALKVPADTGQVVRVESIMRQVQEPLSRLPGLFFPTGLGLLFALLLMALQRWVEASLAKTWEHLDLYTQTELLAEFKPKISKPDLTAKRMARAVRLLSRTSKKLDATMSSVSNALTNLGNLDQSKWANELMAASTTFSQAVTTGGDKIASAATEISKVLQTLPETARQFKQSAKELSSLAQQVGTAAERMERVARSTDQNLKHLAESESKLLEIQAKIAELSTSFDNLTTNLGGVNTTFTGWISDHQSQLRELSQNIGTLTKSLQPLIQQGHDAGQVLAENANATIGALKVCEKEFEKQGTRLNDLLTDQRELFGVVANDMAQSLRDGHERFMVEVTDRFDQGEALYARLDGLKAALAEEAKRLDGAGGQIKRLVDFIPEYQSGVRGASTQFGDLQKGLGAVLQTLQASLQRSGELERRMVSTMEEITGVAQSFRSAPRFGEDDLVKGVSPIVKELQQVTSAVNRVAGRNGHAWPVNGGIWQRWRTVLMNYWPLRRGGANGDQDRHVGTPGDKG